MPRLSVLMPARNSAATVGKAVSSTLNAMPSDAELVVYDDASTDATVAAIERAAWGRRRRVRVISGGEQVGVSAALRALTRQSDSEFIARMDADDVTLRGRFRAQRAAIQDCDVVYTAMKRLQDGKRTPALREAISANAAPFHLLLGNPFAHPTMYIRRSALEGVGGYGHAVAEDYELLLALGAAGVRIVRIPRIGLIYRVHGTQTTQDGEWKRRRREDPGVDRQYRRLSRHLLGTEFAELSALASDGAPDPGARIEAFRLAFIDAIASSVRSERERAALTGSLNVRIKALG